MIELHHTLSELTTELPILLILLILWATFVHENSFGLTLVIIHLFALAAAQVK